MATESDAVVGDPVAFGRWLVQVKGGCLHLEESASIRYQLHGVPTVVIAPEAFQGAVARYRAIQPNAPAEAIWEVIWIIVSDSWDRQPMGCWSS